MGLLDDAIREHLELKRRRGADAGDISREESEALGPVRRGPDGAPDIEETFVPPADTAGEAPPPASTPPWESEQTAVLGAVPAPDEPPPVTGYEPPAAPAYERPPADPEPTASMPAPPADELEPPAPPPPSSEPAWRTYESSSPPPAPASDRPWFEARRASDKPEDDPFADVPEPDLPDPEPEAEHPSLLSRFRVGRKSKHGSPPAPSDESPADYEPPPLPASYEPAAPYEPPPAPAPPSHGYQPPPAHHESDIVPADDEPEVEDVLEETPDFLEETPEHDRLWFEQRPPRDFDFDDK